MWTTVLQQKISSNAIDKRRKIAISFVKMIFKDYLTIFDAILFAAESSLLYGDKWRTDFIFLQISKERRKHDVEQRWG